MSIECDLENESWCCFSTPREKISFAHCPCILSKRFVSKERISKMMASSAAWPSRRVNCGLQNVTWMEQTIPTGSELSEFFRSAAILSQLLELLGRSAQCKATVQCWLSRYGVGEFINSHRDNEGDIQIVLGASSLQPEDGGFLSVSYEEFSASYFLLLGDAIIFKATSVQHSTSPVIETATNQIPERIVAVARYSFCE